MSSPPQLRRSVSSGTGGKLSVSGGITRPSSSQSDASHYTNLQLDTELAVSGKLSPVLRSYLLLYSRSNDSLYRVATWCCDGIANQTDSLDILLFNEGQPIDILLLQSTQGPCPMIGNLCDFRS